MNGKKVSRTDNIYISRILGPVSSDTDKSTSTVLSVGIDSANTIRREVLKGIIPDPSLRVSLGKTDNEISKRMPRGEIDHFETETGFVVHGAIVRYTFTQRNARVHLLSNGHGRGRSAVIRVIGANPVISVLVKLADGRSAVLAAMQGYIGYAKFNRDGLANVSYVPSSNNYRHWAYKRKEDEINRLRALVAVSVEHNTFNIRSEHDAEMLARKIRVEKSIDPTLGLYAAHGYNQAGQDKHVADVLRYMERDIQAVLYDLMVLSSRIKPKPVTNQKIVPFCPMLTQTWNLLRPRGIKIPEVLNEASFYLCNSLWTTFQPKATDKIIQAIKAGELK